MPNRYILFYPPINVEKLEGVRVIDVRKCKFTEIDVMDDPQKVVAVLGEPLFVVDANNVNGKFSELFYQCRFWEAHEILEEKWRRAKGEEKDYLHALILICASLINFLKNKVEVSDKLMDEALSLISKLPEDLLPLLYVRLSLDA
ncbi:MAG: DUF309 domain-containing protein [Candidatus Aramenus sp.]|nr:DUF309 domain-containing protein [Candidatus Aramenus sp.]